MPNQTMEEKKKSTDRVFWEPVEASDLPIKARNCAATISKKDEFFGQVVRHSYYIVASWTAYKLGSQKIAAFQF